MTRFSHLISRAAHGLVAVAFITACADSLPTEAASTLQPRPLSAPVTLVVSDTDAAPGTHITVTVRATPAGGALHAVEGGLAYDPATLRYVGQDASTAYPVAVNPDVTGLGEIRFLAFSPTGLPAEFVTLSFAVQRAGYAPSLEYRHRHAVRGRTAREPVELAGRAALVESASGHMVSPARVMSLADWSAKVQVAGNVPQDDPTPAESFVARYGDVTLDGRIDLLDYLAVAFAAVGTDELILGTHGAARRVDLVTAGNVAPAIAGLACGVEENGHRELTLYDYLAIAFEATGFDEACVGDRIPGRARPLPRVTVGASQLVITPGVTRRFSADTIYHIAGVLRVENGGKAIVAPGARLEFADGPSHGFRASSGLDVRPGGVIIALGTVAAPIVLTCAGADPQPGCWGGVDIAGSGSAVVASVFEYLRVEYAGGHGNSDSGDAASAGAALRLIGMSTRAVVRRVQVHGAAGVGLELRGGDLGVREVLLTGNAGAGILLRGAQTGSHSRIIVQAARHAPTVQGGVVIDTDAAAQSPTTALRLERLTLVGNLAPRETAAIWLNARAPVNITGVVVTGYGTAVQRSESALCAATMVACTAAQVIHLEAAAHWLRGAFDTQGPDWRPAPGAPAEAGQGAADAGRDGVVPWFAGWTRGFRASETP